MGGKLQDNQKVPPHLEWAQKAHTYVMKRGLVTRFGRMVEIKARQGKEPLADWYSLVCRTWDAYGLDFGTGPAMTQANAGAYKKWVKNKGTPKKIKNRLEARINKIMRSYPPPKGKPRTAARFYSLASAEMLADRLPSGESLGGADADNKNVRPHFEWAEGRTPNAMQRRLVEKFGKMLEIKKRQGIKNEPDKEALARWYAFVCSRWAQYGVDFGSPEANSKTRVDHKAWALQQGRGPAEIRQQLTMRIRKTFKSYAQQVPEATDTGAGAGERAPEEASGEETEEFPEEEEEEPAWTEEEWDDSWAGEEDTTWAEDEQVWDGGEAAADTAEEGVTGGMENGTGTAEADARGEEAGRFIDRVERILEAHGEEAVETTLELLTVKLEEALKGQGGEATGTPAEETAGPAEEDAGDAGDAIDWPTRLDWTGARPDEEVLEIITRYRSSDDAEREVLVRHLHERMIADRGM